MKNDLEKAQFGAIVRAGKRMVEGVKAAKSAYKVASEAEKLNQIKTAKRAAAAKKAKATREANKVAKAKAAEEVAAKPKRGRPTKVQPVTSKSEAPKQKSKELKFYNTKTKKYEVPAKKKVAPGKPKTIKEDVKNTLTPAKIIGTAVVGTGLGVGLRKYEDSKSKQNTVPSKPVKTTPATNAPFKPKGVVKKVLKSAGRYTFAKGGVAKNTMKTKKR